MRKKVNIYMKVSTFAYNCGQGIRNIKRNKLFSLASVGTITACIFLIGVFYIIIANFQHMVKEAEDSVCVTVFFDDDVTEEQIKDIGNKISKRVEVSQIKYTSAEEAWSEFSEQYFKDDPDLAEGFKEDNPLAKSANYEIYLNDLSMQSTLVSYLKSLNGVRKVNDSPVTANTLTDFAKMVGYISIAIIAILLAVGIFLISNTVMIGITVRKEEIKIMKLIGATDFFVRAPFIVEGVLIGIVGAIIPVVILMVIYQKIVVYLLTQFQSFTSYVTFISQSKIFSVIIPMSLLIGAGIGFLGSMITIRKHLKV
jgi:cell division transport system permease protein